MGTIVKLTGLLDLICYVDSDFAGLFGHEDPRNKNSARSLCGYVISLGGMILYWKSTLLTAITLSTLEAEYQSLSLSMRQVIAYKLLIEELVEAFGMGELRSKIVAKVFEDNQGALYLATNQRLTNRTKYFHVKWHHFWSQVGEEPPKIQVGRVDTDNQKADYLTKALPREVFERNRKQVQHW